MSIIKTGCKGVDWNHVAQDRVHWRSLAKNVTVPPTAASTVSDTRDVTMLLSQKPTTILVFDKLCL